MNPQSARALVWLAAIFWVMGAMVGSPVGALAMLVISALCVVAPVLRGPRGARIAGAAVLAMSLALAFAQIPKAKGEFRAYQARGAVTHETGGEPTTGR